MTTIHAYFSEIHGTEGESVTVAISKSQTIQLVLHDPYSFAAYRTRGRDAFLIPPYGPFLKIIINDPADDKALREICSYVYARLALFADLPLPRFERAYPADTAHLTEDFLVTQPDIYALPEGQLESVGKIVSKVAQIGASKFEVATERLIYAMRHGWKDDKHSESIIDTAIGLEAIYNDHEQPISYTIAMRAAFLLETIPSRRQLLYKFLKTMYGIRSKLVHGNVQNDSSNKGYTEASDWTGTEVTSREALAMAYREVLRKTLRTIANKELPVTGDKFDLRILGAAKQITKKSG